MEEVTGSRELYANPSSKSAEAFTHEEGQVDGPQANNQIEYIQGSSNFSEMTLEEAMSAVDEGGLVFATWQNPAWTKGTTGNSGHINVLLPGDKYPGTWDGEKMDLPTVFDLGGQNRWPDANKPQKEQKLNNAFGKTKQASVNFSFTSACQGNPGARRSRLR